jgi:hypothetical protein
MGSDHVVFNDGRIGIPGVMLSNWPDPFLHSSDDDLMHIDPTQLERNAFVVACSAYFIASMGEAGAARLAALVLDGSTRRLAHAGATAISLAVGDSDRTAEQRYRDASLLMDEVARHEQAVVASALPLVPAGGAGQTLLRSALEAVTATAKQARTNVDRFYFDTMGALPRAAATAEEGAAQALVPEWSQPLAESLRQHDVSAGWSYGCIGCPAGLHPFYASEIFMLIDGKRSVLDIYRTARAASLVAGEWFNGLVTLPQGTQVIERAAKSGAIRMR